MTRRTLTLKQFFLSPGTVAFVSASMAGSLYAQFLAPNLFWVVPSLQVYYSVRTFYYVYITCRAQRRLMNACEAWQAKKGIQPELEWTEEALVLLVINDLLQEGIEPPEFQIVKRWLGLDVNSAPPRAAELVIALCSKPELREGAVGCAAERFTRDLEARGRGWATVLYWSDALRSAPPLALALVGRSIKSMMGW